MISHSKDGSVRRQLVGKLMDNDNEQVSDSSLQTGCTYKQITAQKCVKLRYPTHKRQRVQRQTNAHVIHSELQEKCTKMSRTELTGQLAKWNFLKHLNANKNNSLLYETQ
jgi:hypothetical protein